MSNEIEERVTAEELAPKGKFAALNYQSYLKIPELLQLQECIVGERSHDELLFITIHQAYELWFKQILFELDTIARLVRRGQFGEARRLCDRVVTIEKVLVDQIHILETMTPRDFCHFRAALRPASGFQSVQFREVEFVSGLKSPGYLEHFDADSPDRARLQRRLDEPSLPDILYERLRADGFDLPEGFEDDPALFEEAIKALLPVYIQIEEHFELYQLLEALVSHDEWISIWRFHHVRAVERIIGSKPGTGGSPGIRYLERTVAKRAFPLLWAVRSNLDEDALFGTYEPPV